MGNADRKSFLRLLTIALWTGFGSSQSLIALAQQDDMPIVGASNAHPGTVMAEAAKLPDPNEPIMTPPVTYSGNNIRDCIEQLTGAGWCEIEIDATKSFRELKGSEWVGDWGVLGPPATWIAWNGAAISYPKMWFHGGGHNDSGMTDVYELDLEAGSFERIFTPPPWDMIYYNARTDLYAQRHNPENIPEGTHTYDGFMYDPETGLLLLCPGAAFRLGFRSAEELDPDNPPTPDDPRVFTESGLHGMYAFNPTNAVIKSVEPKEWRRLFNENYCGAYPRSAYLGNNTYVFGGNTGLYQFSWDGDNFNYVKDWGKTLYEWPGTLAVIHGKVHSRHWEFIFTDLPSRKYTKTPAYTHSYSIAETDNPDVILMWSGYDTIFEQNIRTGDYTAYDWTDSIPGARDGAEKVYSKWFRHPDHNDIYIGWASSTTGPMVYRHSGDNGYALSPVTLHSIVNDSDNVVVPKNTYGYGVSVKGSKTVNFSWSTIFASSSKGYVIVDGGPHILKNLSVTKPGRSGIWAEATPNFTLDGFDIAHQNFGVITSNDGGNVVLKNGTIRDGRSPSYGREHNIYAGEIDSLTVDNIKSIRHHSGGHLFKSRAPYNLIENSTFDGDQSNHSRVLDFPCGGHIEIRNSTMIQSKNSDNDDLIAIAVESCKLPKSTLILENTNWVANRPNARFMTSHEKVDIECVGINNFVGIPSPCH